MWGVRGRALSDPQLPALWARCRGPLPTGCGCGGGAGVGTRYHSHSARSCELALRAVGAARGCPGGAPPAWVWGVRGRALYQPRLPALWAGCRGPLPTCCGCGGVRAWGPVTNTTARALACCGGGLRVPGGGASCLGVGLPGSGALPPPTARPLGGVPGPTTHWLWVRGGAGVGTRHQPHSARSCKLALRAVEAARGRPGGAPLAWVWGVRGRALSHPRLPALLAGCRGPLPTGCGCGGVRAWGPVTNPTARALACCGGGLRVPGGGASCLGVGRLGSGALPPPTARPLGGLPGLTTHWLRVREGAGVGTHHQLHSARSCELALRALRATGGRPGGAPPAWVRGVRGRALSHPRLPALWAGCRGPLPTGCGCGGVRASGPVPNPTARALASWLCALWGWHEDARRGRLLPACGASGVRRSPTPDCPPSERAAGAHYPLAVGAGGCGRGDPSPTPQLALLRAGFARCGGGRRAPGGAASCLGVWRPGSGALPPPTARPLGGLPEPTTHWLWVRGGAGMGTRHQPHSARSCVLLGRLEGARGGRLLPGCGASGVGRSPTPNCPPSGWAARAHYPLAVGAGGCQRGGPAVLGTLSRAAVRGVLCVSRVRGTSWPLWLGTCPCAVVVAGGVPLWRASWPRVGAPLLVRSGRSRYSGRLSRRRGAFPHPRGCRPWLYWVAARGTWRPAENRAHCACRWPLPRQGCWARSASYPFRAPRWGCFWRVPLASVLGCVRCGGLACVDPVTDASRFPYRSSCDGGLGRCTGAVLCDADTAPFGSEDATPGSHACVLVRALLARVGPAGLPGAFWCASPFLLAVLGSLFACSPPFRAGVAPLVVVVGFFCFFLFPFPLPPLLRPRCLLLCVFSGPGCPGPWRLVAPPPPPFFFFFFLCPPPPPCCLRRFLLSGCLGPLRPPSPPPFFFPWFVCPVVFCLCVVLCCGAPFFFPVSLSACALVSCCSPLVLGSGPVSGRFCFCALPVQCCAGVPASLLSVRCSLALAGLAGVLCCCLLCLCVCCWAWLSSVVFWWVLVAPGVVSRWRAVVCPWVLCCAVLLPVLPPGVALLCAVLFRFARFGAAARCVVSWGAVRRLGVLCLLAPCFVLSPHAVCVLLWCVAAWCCSPLYFVPCAPWGVVLCVSCHLCPVRCCCVARSPSLPCSPVLCPVVLCCRVVPWFPVPPPCWVCFLRGCGCTYLKNRCKMS